MEPKSIFASKTFWFNALTIVTAVAALFGYAPNQELADDAAMFLVSMSPIVNILLRMWTSKPVHFSMPELSARDELEK